MQVALCSEAAGNNTAEIKQNMMSGEGVHFMKNQRRNRPSFNQKGSHRQGQRSQQSKNSGKSSCACCGRLGHDKRDCLYKHYKCYVCNV